MITPVFWTFVVLLSTLAVFASADAAHAADFVHPGILHTRADLDRIKKNVAQGVEPWKSGFEKLKADPQSQADWKVRGGFADVIRDPAGSRHNDELARDGNAAYQNALVWYFTSDESHAKKAVEILNAWSGTLQHITGHDKELAASLYGFKYVNAAEILRYTYDGWKKEDIARFESLLRNVFYPVIKGFATFANGNWDTGCIKTMMAFGVFLNDRAMFDRAVDYYYNGSGNGRLTHYIINETGQCQESGRDQQHVQLGIAHLAETSEIGWNQGLDMYGAADNRLLKGFEYTAKYLLGEDVPFVRYRDKTGKYDWATISDKGRDRLRPIFEMVYNHYKNRRGIEAPYTQRAAEKLRPEGGAFQADHPGFGTLLFTRSYKPVKGPATKPTAATAVWQWSVPVASLISSETNAPPRAFLWIPPNCQRVRAVVVGQHNMEEEGILEHPAFRQAMADRGVAAIWVTPAIDLFFRFDQGAGEHFNAMMTALAKESGYRELEFAPIVPIGHSAAASYPWNFAAWNPARTLAAISVSGQWPYWKDQNTPDWGARTVDGIPGLVMMGEYEWANDRAADGLKQRMEHPQTPLSMLAEPGGGHFDYSDTKVEFLALYLRKAVQYRLPENAPFDRPVELKPIDPTRQGWLVERWHVNDTSKTPAAPVGKYTGNPKEAFWCFDEEMVRATEAFAERYRGKKVDLLGYMQDGKVVPQVDGTHQQVTLPFVPIGDGLTFQLTGTFLDTVPKGRPERWTGLPEGSPVGHASGGGPVTISRICGPVEQIGPDAFAIRFYRMGMDNKKRSNEIWIVATHPGDDQYRRSVQQSVLHFPLRNTVGAPQKITLPAIPNQSAGVTSLKLQATSDANVPVHYYVLAGPAFVDGDTLRFTEIPPRSKYPVKVTVVAWQWGRSIEPRLQTAEPVVREFYLER
jgi:hypothetical protein